MRVAQVLAVLSLMLGPGPAPAAQGSPAEIRVATRVLPPLVVQQDADTLSGFSIDLWNEIGKRLQFKTRYDVAPDVVDLLERVRSGADDVGISALSITAARE